jgi:hypothetical protein
VARAAIAAGAEIINDVSGFRDAAMRDALRATNAAAIVMHMQGDPRNMQRAPHYDDVRGEIREFFDKLLRPAYGVESIRCASLLIRESASEKPSRIISNCCAGLRPCAWQTGRWWRAFPENLSSAK